MHESDAHVVGFTCSFEVFMGSKVSRFVSEHPILTHDRFRVLLQESIDVAIL